MLSPADAGCDTARQLPVLSWGEKALQGKWILLRVNQGRVLDAKA